MPAHASPSRERFQRALAAQIGTIQLSSSSAGLHTPLDTGATSLLWVPGRGEGGGGHPGVVADESEAVPPRIQMALGEGEGGEGSKGAQLNAHL